MLLLIAAAPSSSLPLLGCHFQLIFAFIDVYLITPPLISLLPPRFTHFRCRRC